MAWLAAWQLPPMTGLEASLLSLAVWVGGGIGIYLIGCWLAPVKRCRCGARHVVR